MKYTTENDIERYCLQLLEHLGYTCIHQTAPTGRSNSAKRAKDALQTYKREIPTLFVHNTPENWWWNRRWPTPPL